MLRLYDLENTNFETNFTNAFWYRSQKLPSKISKLVLLYPHVYLQLTMHVVHVTMSALSPFLLPGGAKRLLDARNYELHDLRHLSAVSARSPLPAGDASFYHDDLSAV